MTTLQGSSKLTKEVFETWIPQYIDRGWYLFFVNPNNKQPFSHLAFELPEETERRLREVEEEKNDPSLEKEARAKARKDAQKYGHGLADATNMLGTPNDPDPGTLYWLFWKSYDAANNIDKNGKTYTVWPQLACATGKSGLF